MSTALKVAEELPPFGSAVLPPAPIFKVYVWPGVTAKAFLRA
jgi:hypothetical protein